MNHRISGNRHNDRNTMRPRRTSARAITSETALQVNYYIFDTVSVLTCAGVSKLSPRVKWNRNSDVGEAETKVKTGDWWGWTVLVLLFSITGDWTGKPNPAVWKIKQCQHSQKLNTMNLVVSLGTESLSPALSETKWKFIQNLFG